MAVCDGDYVAVSMFEQEYVSVAVCFYVCVSFISKCVGVCVCVCVCLCECVSLSVHQLLTSRTSAVATLPCPHIEYLRLLFMVCVS